MKKLVLTVTLAVLTSGVSIYALESNNNNNPNEIIKTVVNNEFKEIAIADLPAAVSEAITKDFESATVTKVYVNASEQYKIEIKVDEKETVVYADKEGSWLKEEDIITEKGSKLKM
ncbi:hypothetical protein KO506_03150 [Polaribacter vadi]|uniref:hypothetical protein n=1 Tax=Polaribacter TaxID=52959 RepID=UPI001C083882|nr:MULTISPECIES: hypothetical protein [Polaribacter]MBU3010384.1 hypothetical protein [Polaribacter vadi]MDO6740191.1 hypothetical protein [Polaribacter sp. 1_MG-2023]